MLLEGIILRGYSGFYYVKAGEKVYECSLRGRHRVKKQDFLPGDKVKFLAIAEIAKGVIEEVLPRQTILLRPPVANVTQVVIVIALASPTPDLVLLDRLLVLTEEAGINPVICFNKLDVAPEESLELYKLYSGIGYRVFLTSAKKGTGIEELKKELRGKVSVFAGPSGAGKSSLLNALQPGLELKTGEVGEKSQRGKHTTRHVALLPLEGGGLVADAPGFSRLHLPEMKREELAFYFPEFAELQNNCKFNSCLHKSEPECAVKAALDRELIDRRRYEHYLNFLEEVIAKERSY